MNKKCLINFLNFKFHGASSVRSFHTNFFATQQSKISFQLSQRVKDKEHKRKEGSSKDGLHEIYYGPLSSKIRMLKLITISSSLTGVLVQYTILTKPQTDSIAMLAIACTVVSIFTFITPILIHIITRKYVIKLYHDPVSDDYTALLLTFFIRKKLVKFNLDEVSRPSVPRMFTTVFVTNKHVPLFLDVNAFQNLEHYKRIMGYDKPIDFQFHVEEQGSTNSKEESSKKLN